MGKRRRRQETFSDELLHEITRDIQVNPGNSPREALKFAEMERIRDYFPPDRGALLLLFLCSIAVLVVIIISKQWNDYF